MKEQQQFSKEIALIVAAIRETPWLFAQLEKLQDRPPAQVRDRSTLNLKLGEGQ